ncbi:MAG TPA: PQQ-dependent sugar dehydrogenase [Nitrososphaeraceae archaeon]
MNYRKFMTCITVVSAIVLLALWVNDFVSVSGQGKQTKKYDYLNITDSNLKFEVMAKGFKFATGMVFLDSNDILVTEKNTGNVIRIQNGIKLDKPVLAVNVSNQSERGLLGIAVTDEGSVPRYVFLYFTETDSENRSKILGNRLYRYELVANNSQLINPKLLLNLPFLPGPSHNGGVLKIGPDRNSLYIAIGNLNFIQDPRYFNQAQNVKNSPPPDGRGGILRITYDGNVIGGKGILGEISPLNLYYAYGLRNSFGIGFDHVTGNLWDTENGQDTNDEINLVKPGFNSGFRVIQGPSSLKENFKISDLESFEDKGIYRDPEFDWLDTVAPTSVLFLNSSKLGKDYESDLFVGSVKNGTIYHFDMNDDRTHLDLDGPLRDRIANTPKELAGVTFAKGLGIITDLEVGPDGYLYVLSFPKHDGTIFRISPR